MKEEENHEKVEGKEQRGRSKRKAIPTFPWQISLFLKIPFLAKLVKFGPKWLSLAPNGSKQSNYLKGLNKTAFWGISFIIVHNYCTYS